MLYFELFSETEKPWDLTDSIPEAGNNESKEQVKENKGAFCFTLVSAAHSINN